MERYTEAEVATAANVPRQTLTYWREVGLLVPSLPDNRYSAPDMSRALVMADVARLGAHGPILRTLVDQLAGDTWSWPEHLWIDARGCITDSDVAPAAWVVHPRRVLAHAGPLLLLALSAPAESVAVPAA